MQKQYKLNSLNTGAGHHVMRLLIASYFIAMASGIIPTDNGHALMAAIVPNGYENLAFSVFVFTTAYLILLGERVRIAALLLANYVFWSSYIENLIPGNILNLKEFWRDIALVGGLLLTYGERDQSRSKLFRFGRLVQPRRVHPKHTPMAARGHKPAAEMLRRPDSAELPRPLALRNSAERDVVNIFHGVFEAS